MNQPRWYTKPPQQQKTMAPTKHFWNTENMYPGAYLIRSCLFSIQIQSLEDVPEFDQHKHYSVKFKTEQSQGTTAIQTVHPHLDISDDTRDDYQFINNHLQIAQMDDTSNRASRRAFRNSVSSFTMLKDSSLTSYKVDFNEKIEFVQQMQWNMKAFEDIQASPLHPVKFHMELREVCGFVG